MADTGTADTDEIVSGRWIEVGVGDGDDGERPLANRDELVLAVADRRGTDPTAVAAEFERIDERFDVDAVYLAPAPE